MIDPLKVLGLRILPGVLISGMLGGLYLLIRQMKKTHGMEARTDGDLYPGGNDHIFYGLHST